MQASTGLLALALLLSVPAGAQPGNGMPLPRFEAASCNVHDVPGDWAAEHGVDCGWLHVRESRQKAAGRALRLWVAIARARKPDGGAPLLYIHGGPGPGTVDYFFPYFPKSKTWPAFRATRDLVFFDQRGTGRSDPAFCPGLKATLEDLRRKALPPREDVARTESAFAACRATLLAQGFDFDAYTTRANVEDAEDLRLALGVRQWNLYGISYGTLVALDYLRRYPGSVRAAILDSVYPPDSPHGAEQITATALAYDAMQRSCDRDDVCRARFPDILARLAAAVKRLDADPLRADGGGVIDGARLRSALWAMLVTSSMVEWVPLAIDRAAAGDAAAVRTLVRRFGGFDGFGDYSPGLAQAVNCHDLMVGETAPRVRAAMARHPALADADAIAEETDRLCAAWQRGEAPAEFFAPVGSDVPALLYGGEFDPATPYEDAVRAKKALTAATLVEVTGASHAGMGRDACTRGIAHAFLRDPAQAPDTACLAARAPIAFRSEGLALFLQSMEE